MQETHTFVWDGNNIVLEKVEFADGTTRTFEYFWSADKSGTEQGAGGVEGLLAVSLAKASPRYCWRSLPTWKGMPLPDTLRKSCANGLRPMRPCASRVSPSACLPIPAFHIPTLSRYAARSYTAAWSRDPSGRGM